MWPYWVLFMSTALAVFLPRLPTSEQRWIWSGTLCSLALLIGLRHEVGGDWYTYEFQHRALAHWTIDDVLAYAKDPGYTLLDWLFAQAGFEIYAVNLVCAFMLALGTVALIRRQPRPTLGLVAAVPYLLIVVGMGYTRQAAAIGLAMMALVALQDRRQRLFTILILLAATFHKSAVLLLPIAALAATRNRILTYAWVGLLGVVGAWLFIYDSSEALWAAYVTSDYADASQGAAIRVMMNALPSGIALVLGRRLFPDPAERKLWLWLAALSLATVPLLALSATAVDRMALYLIPLQLVVFARLPRAIDNLHVRTLATVGVVGYYAAVQFIWLNFASHADAWVPYRLMPLD